jgi:choice-of-anchor B domain-containing protein
MLFKCFNQFRWRSTFKLALFVTLLLVLVTGISITSNVAAHPEGPAHHNPLPTHATDVMRAFANNDHAPQALAATSTTTCVGGLAGTYPCSNVDLESFLPLNAIGGTSSNSAANDIWGWTDPVTGREYAIIGLVFGTSFVDISDPANPVYLGELPTHGAFGSSWRDIKTYNDHAFIVSEANQHGMQVFDLTQLRNVTNPPVTFSETAHYNKNASAHNIIINEDSGYAYIVGASGKNSCSGGLHMVDISNPTSPSFAGCFSSDGYTHDAQCVIYNGPDTDHQGKEICFNANEDTITIVDVTNKNSPVQLSRTGYSGSAYTHQGWLTENQVHFLIDDELDEQNFGHNTRTRVFDVSDLDAPSFVGSYDSGNSAIDHNQYVKGNFSYQANYRSGLRILDISGVAAANLTEVAFFDIYPANDAAQFNAAWSNYPYFDSGIVVVSGIEQGLFVLRPNLGPVDNPPSVNVTDPAEGAVVSGTSVLIAANAADDNGVNQVEFFVDGNSIGVDTTAPYSVSWDSTAVPDGAHIISATATDTIGQTLSDNNNVDVDNVADPMLHIGDLDPSGAPGGQGKWNATVMVTVHDSGEAAVANATVNGSWSAGANGSGSCVTDGSGHCSISKNNIRPNSSSVTFTVDSVTHASLLYNADDNHDPDGDSNGTEVIVLKP